MFIPPKQIKYNSIYALMPNGPMKEESLGRLLYNKLMAAYTTDYEDNVDKKAILSAISSNYYLELESAWQAFLAEIGEDQ